MNMLFSKAGKYGLLAVLLCTFLENAPAQNPLFISPWGATIYLKKRKSESDFSFAAEYDYRISHIRLNSRGFFRITEGKTETTGETIGTSDSALGAGYLYRITKAGYTKLDSSQRILAKFGDKPVNWIMKDPSSGKTLQCRSVAGEWKFNSLLPLPCLTITKTAPGLQIKEVYVEGYGLVVYVRNNEIYTQMLGDYQHKADMMSELGYTDSMACLLVNETNFDYYTKKQSDWILTLSKKLSEGPLSWQELNLIITRFECRMRPLIINFVHQFNSSFKGLQPGNISLRSLSLFWENVGRGNLTGELASGIQGSDSLKIWVIRQQSFLEDGVDRISFDRLGGNPKKELHDKHYLYGMIAVADLLQLPAFTYPYNDEEIDLYYYYASLALEKRDGDPQAMLPYVRAYFYLKRHLLNVYIAKSHSPDSATATGYSYTACNATNKFLTEYFQYKKKYDTALSRITEASLLELAPALFRGCNMDYRLFENLIRLKAYPQAFIVFRDVAPRYNFCLSFSKEMGEMAKALHLEDTVAYIILREMSSAELQDRIRALAALGRWEIAEKMLRSEVGNLLAFFGPDGGGKNLVDPEDSGSRREAANLLFTEIRKSFDFSRKPRRPDNILDEMKRVDYFYTLVSKWGENELAQKLRAYNTALGKYL